MLINGAPINGATLNGAPPTVVPVEPVYVVRGQSFTWRLRLMVGGDELTTQLTGVVDVDREEGAAGVAGFVLYLPPGPVVPPDWVGQDVTLDYISRDRYGVETEARVFTGRIEQPAWDATSRLLSCECSDQRQTRVEGMSIAAIDALVQGYWSADLYDPVEGRSRWDYAEERLASRAASLDCSPTGELRVTGWFASPTPHFVFGAGTTLDQSVQIELQPLGAITNRMEIEGNYRYPRLWQHSQSFSWSHPEYGSSGVQGFCQWRVWTSDLPTTDEVESAISGAGLTLLGQVGGFKLPGNMANPCGDGVPWINAYDNLWLGINVTGARRWVQTVTEQYRINLVAPGGEAEATWRVGRDSASVEIESEQADNWESGLGTSSGAVGSGTEGDTDLTDEDRRQLMLHCLIQGGHAKLVQDHRGTTVSWQTVTDLAMAVDLAHTLKLDDKAQAQGKCRRIQHSFDLGSGSAITSLSVAVMRGGGESDPLNVPASPDTSLPPPSGSGGALGTQLGGRLNHPITGNPIAPYNPELLGFSGNWTAADQLTAAQFPHRFQVQSVEIPEQYRDERTGEVVVTIRVGIPNDLLEL